MHHPVLARSREQIVTAVSTRLTRRATSSFGQLGPSVCQAFVDQALVALDEDLTQGKKSAVRTFVYALIEELAGIEVTYLDLRSLCLTLRKHVREALDTDTDTEQLRPAVEAWFFELLLVISVRFMAWRDEVTQRESAKHNIANLESQLTELEAALIEKTQLLQMIREASTPIVPVVAGILVVPLIGTFDTYRAELLAQSLLSEVSRVRTHAAIIDVSGVPLFDTDAAQMIIKITRSLRLLGTEALLVGLSPTSAQTIVDLGIELGEVQTFGTLRDGLAAALRSQRLQISSF